MVLSNLKPILRDGGDSHSLIFRFLTCFPDQAARVACLGAAPKILGDPSYRTLEEGIRANLEYAKKDLWRSLQRALGWVSSVLRHYKQCTPSWKPQEQKKLQHFGRHSSRRDVCSTLSSSIRSPHSRRCCGRRATIRLRGCPPFLDPRCRKSLSDLFWFLLQSWARAVHSTQTLPKRSVRYEKVEKKLINSPVPVPGLGTFNYTVQHHLITGVAIDPNNFFPFLAAVLAEAERGTAGDSFPL